MECVEHEHQEMYVGSPVEENTEPPVQNLGWKKICHPVLPPPDHHVTEKEAGLKYIDDNVMAEAVDMSEVVPITHHMERPLNYRDRTLHQIPNVNSSLQTKLIEIDRFCDVQQMVINKSKTKTAVFNSAIKKDFYPRFVNSDGTEYENVEEFKLLGADFVSHPRTGVKWDKYLLKCIKQAYANMWILKRLSELGVSVEDKLMTYESRVRISFWSKTLHCGISQSARNLAMRLKKYNDPVS